MSKQVRFATAGGRGCCGLDEVLETRFFKALCDPTRAAILAELAECGGRRTVGEIAARFPIDVSVVSRHLAVLRDAGVVAAEKEGREVRYRALYGALVSTLRGLADAIEACCPPKKSERAAERGAERAAEAGAGATAGKGGKP